MKQIQKRIQLPEELYYEMHLTIINCILPVKMTPTEAKTIAAFMSLKGDIVEYRFGASAKKMVMAQLGLSPAGLSNYMGQLLEKGFLQKSSEGVISILPLLLPEEDEQFYVFKLVKQQNEKDKPGGTDQGALGESKEQVSTP